MLVPTIDGVPVLLPKHSHPAFGDPGYHYHVDYRYCDGPFVQSRVIFSDKEPVLMDLPQKRAAYQIDLASFRLPMFLARHHKKLTACGACPHKGLPVYPVSGGISQCVGHGLIFDANGDSIDEFYIRPKGVSCERHRLDYGPKMYEFIVTAECYVDTAIIETVDGTQIGAIPLPIKARVYPGDILRISRN